MEGSWKAGVGIWLILCQSSVSFGFARFNYHSLRLVCHKAFVWPFSGFKCMKTSGEMFQRRTIHHVAQITVHFYVRIALTQQHLISTKQHILDTWILFEFECTCKGYDGATVQLQYHAVLRARHAQHLSCILHSREQGGEGRMCVCDSISGGLGVGDADARRS
jgi:hypothetical protein